jgi:ABC-type sugar transport system ATPase subunit
MNSPALIDIRKVSKSYGGVHALTDVSMQIAPGEVHALCGENGAGKSTLIKVLAGSVTSDCGEVLVNGNALPPGNVRASEAAGIAVIHQESVAFPHLSAFDNIFVGREPRRWGGLFLDRAAMRRQTRALLERLGEADSFDPARPVGELSVAQRQMVAMARALSHDCRLLVMDEPTASLSERETRVLFNLIRQFKQQGVSILYVSHRLDEVFELADRVTVFGDHRDPAGHGFADGVSSQWFAVEENFAGVELVGAEDGAGDFGAAGADEAGHADDFARAKVEGNVVEGAGAREVVDLEQR